MAGRVRAHDWASTSLGAIETWPQSLRTVVDIVLASGHAMQLAWGPERIVLYNDAYAPMLGDRHPSALGLPFREAWPDIWKEIEPLVARVFAGETVRFENMPLVMTRHGYAEDTWWNFSYSPVRDEAGAVAGLLNVTVDATGRVRADRAEAALREDEQRQRFLLQLSDALRPLTDPIAVQTTAMKMLAERLDVMRATYFELEEDQDTFHLTARFERDAVPIPERMRLSDFSQALIDGYTAGRTLSVSDTAFQSEFVEQPDAYLAIGVRAWAAVPLVREKRLVAWIGLHSAVPRQWSATDLQILEDVAGRLWAEVLRGRAEASSRESEERFRQFAENSTDVLWIVNADTGQLEYLSPSFNAMWGESRERIMTDLSRWSELVHPEDLAKAAVAMPRTLEGETIMQSYRIVRPSDGAVRWIQDTGFPIRDDKGRVTRVGGIAQDLTDRTLTELEIRKRRRELRTLVENIPQLVWRAVDNGHWVWASPQWCEFTGQAEVDSHHWGWLAVVHPDDREGAREAWANAEARNRFEAEYRVHQRQGGYRWFQTRATPLHSEEGALVEWFGTSTDIDDIRRLQEHERLLLSELQHRVRNTLAVIRSIVRRTVATSTTLEDYAMHLEGRIDSFARVQATVTRDPARGVDLEYLVGEELRAVGARENQSATVKGPKVMMSATAAETMALAIHELATNAMKYGALTSPRGEIRVRWDVDPREEGAMLDFWWVESGVSLPAPPTRRGFGTLILTRTIPYELKAETDLLFPPTGVSFHMAVPLERLLLSKQADLMARLTG